MNDSRRTLLLLTERAHAGAVDRAALTARCTVIEAEGLDRALERFRTAATDAVLIVLGDPERALAALNAFTSEFGANAAAYVLLTRCDQMRLSIDAWRGGAHDCVEQNESDTASLWLRIAAAIDKAAGQRRLEQTSELFEAQHRQLQEAMESQRESEERFRVIFEHAPVGISQTSLEGELLDVNQAFCRIVGRPREELLGSTFQRITHPEDLPRSLDLFQRLRAGEFPYYRMEKRYVLPDGSARWVELTRAVARDALGRPRYGIAVVQDISARREAEAALKEADRRKDEFLAMLAHELRNPLAPIQNAVALVRLMAPADPQLRGVADMIDRQTRHMTRLVDDLLELSRVALGKLDLRHERLDIVRVLYSGIEAASSAIETRRQQLDMDLPPEPLYMDGDFTRLAQVVGNLLQNATKFTPAGGRIWLSASADADDVIIRVRDNGVGIPQELLPRIFDLFAQAGPLETRNGLGIGLALVKRLVELHGGSVRAASAGAAQGAEFTVRLPRALSAPPPQNDLGAAQSESQAATRRVLIVDDNADAAESLALVLRLSGHDVATVRDGHSALEAAARRAPDVILLDIGLPDMTGYDVAQALRGDPATHDALLIALTGFGQPEDQQRALTSGFDFHLVKPVDPDTVQALLKQQRPKRSSLD